MSAKKPPKSFKCYERHGSNDAGWGSFGYVYFYRLSVDHSKLFAVKVIPEDIVRMDEITILRQCSHPNIVQYTDCAFQDSLCLIVTELLNSSLSDALRGAKNSLFVLTQSSRGVRINQTPFLPKLSEYEMFLIIENCFQGLMYLHENRIIHRDIYPPNILLEVKTVNNIRSITAKLCDFGLSKHGSDGHQTRLQNIYSAPETNDRTSVRYSLKADVFSLGVVIAEMICDLARESKRLFNDKFVESIRTDWANTVTQGTKYSKKAVKYSSSVKVVLPMTESDPGKRYDVVAAYAAWAKFYYEMTAKTDDDDMSADVGDEMKQDVDIEKMEVEETATASDLAQSALELVRKLNPNISEAEFEAFINRGK